MEHRAWGRWHRAWGMGKMAWSMGHGKEVCRYGSIGVWEWEKAVYGCGNLGVWEYVNLDFEMETLA